MLTRLLISWDTPNTCPTKQTAQHPDHWSLFTEKKSISHQRQDVRWMQWLCTHHLHRMAFLIYDVFFVNDRKDFYHFITHRRKNVDFKPPLVTPSGAWCSAPTLWHCCFSVTWYPMLAEKTDALWTPASSRAVAAHACWWQSDWVEMGFLTGVPGEQHGGNAL